MILFFTFILYGKVPLICIFSAGYNIIWCLLNVNKICDLLTPENIMKENKMSNELPSQLFKEEYEESERARGVGW